MTKPVLIIAEAGVNHDGCMKKAKQLVDIAAEAGVDIVKFQTFKASSLVTQSAAKAEYQRQLDGDSSQYDMLKRLELQDEHFVELQRYANSVGLEFLSTGFDIACLDMLASLGLQRLKIPSGEITNKPYLVRAAQHGLPMILSTGMATLGEIEAALELLLTQGMARENITLLHCTTEYPAPLESVHLRAMNTLATAFDVQVGYSDHTQGIVVPIAAVALGACVIEKHMTYDTTAPGPDHAASLSPQDLHSMVVAIRATERALGSSIKMPSVAEIAVSQVARKSLVTLTHIQAGDRLTLDNIGVKRPGTGISPMQIDHYLNQTSQEDIAADTVLLPSMVSFSAQ